MDAIVKKVWETSISESVPYHGDSSPDAWSIWRAKSETLRVLDVCHVRGEGILEHIAAREIRRVCARDAHKFDSAKEVFDHVCNSWKLWVVGRHKDDIITLLPGKARFFTKDERLPIREDESFCDILVVGAICLQPITHEKKSALEELKSR